MNHEQRQATWHNAFQASGEEICIFYDNCSSMRSIPSEITFSLRWRAGQYFLTDQVDLQDGKRAERYGN
jgi:hypothetical protein